MLNQYTPAAGRLLLSEPFMMDPMFLRSVILLCNHHPVEGSLGFIINQLSGLVVGDVIPELKDCMLPVYLGGPVAPNTLHVIHRCADKIPGATELGNGMYWGGDFEVVQALLRRDEIPSGDIKFFMGYSGWEPEQLNGELQENSWVVCNDYHPDLVFLEEPETIWKEALIAMGPKFAHVANFPINPQWN